MRIAILSESTADEAAIRILVDAALGMPSEEVSVTLRHRGLPSILKATSKVIRHLNYQTAAEGLILLVDGDASPIHVNENDHRGGVSQKCRYCEVSRIVRYEMAQLKKPVDKPLLRVAVAVASPSIEAWLLCSEHPHCTESAWIGDLQRGAHSAATIRELKARLYGRDRGSRPFDRIVESARRRAHDIQRLETAFPNGFGSLARELRSWFSTTKDGTEEGQSPQ